MAQTFNNSHFTFITTYQTTVGCDTSRTIHGGVPDNILDYKRGLKLKKGLVPTSDFAAEILRTTHFLYSKTKEMVMQSYKRYKMFYDKKNKSFTNAKNTNAT